MLEESEYLQRASRVWKQIERAFVDVDPELADCDVAGDVVTIAFASGTKCIVNTQRPTREIWLAAGTRAFHFRYRGEDGAWVDAKDDAREFFATMTEIVKTTAGVELRFDG